MSEQQSVQMAARLYECRDAARTLLGTKYQSRMAEYAQLIRAAALKNKCSTLHATTSLATQAGAGMGGILLLAAFVEMTEPSPADATIAA